MASLTVTTAQVAEMRGLIDPRASIKVLPDNLFTVDLTLGAATDWAWLETRSGRSDSAGEASDFATFLSALTELETSHFNRAVFYRTVGLVISRYRELEGEDAGRRCGVFLSTGSRAVIRFTQGFAVGGLLCISG